jgi:hypothetical protein
MQQWQSSLIIDGKEVPSNAYWAKRRFLELTDNAKILLNWLEKGASKLLALLRCKNVLQCI